MKERKMKYLANMKNDLAANKSAFNEKNKAAVTKYTKEMSTEEKNDYKKNDAT